MVPDEDVKQVAIAAQVRFGKSHELPITSRGRVMESPDEKAEVTGKERGGHEKGCRRGLRREPEDFCGRVRMVADQAAEKGGVVVRHTCTVDRHPDASLTLAQRARACPTLEGCSRSPC